MIFYYSKKADRIMQFIEIKYSLKDKTVDEIYDIIIDLYFAYIQHQSRDD